MRISKTGRLTVLSLAVLALVPSAFAATAGAAGTKPVTAGPPTVSTGSVTHVSGTKADLNGNVNPRTLATTYYFQYGATAAFGAQTTTASVAAGTVPVRVSQPVTGLVAGYHYRLIATNADGTTVGKERIYTVKPTTKVKTKHKKLEFTLPKSFQPIPLGAPFSISGTLTGTGNAGRSIVLQASPYPYRAFVNVGAPILTSATGAFYFHIPSLSVNTRYRVATTGTGIVYSRTVSAQVEARVTLKVRASGRKGLYRLYGTVSPAAVGAHVFFELEKSAPKVLKPEKTGKSEKQSERAEEKGPSFSPKFNTVVKRGTKSLSRFSFVVTIRDTGRYRALVDIPSGPVISGHSSTILLHAAPAKKTKAKSKG